MLIKKRSNLTGVEHELEIPVDVEKFQQWDSASRVERPLVQVHFPELDRWQREYIVSGITQQEWEDMFGSADVVEVEYEDWEPTERILVANSATGIFAPQTAIANIKHSGMSIKPVNTDMSEDELKEFESDINECIERIEKGPEVETYWEDWMHLCDNVVFVDCEKQDWLIDHDEDVWLVR